MYQKLEKSMPNSICTFRSALAASLNLGTERSFQFGCKLLKIWAPLNCNAFLATFDFTACK